MLLSLRPFAARRARRGISMIEALFVLGFAVLFVLGALYLFNQANTGNRNRNAVSQVANVQQAVRTLFAGQADYGTGDITAALATSRQLPQNMISGTTIRHAFGGTVTVTGVAAGAWQSQTVNVPTFVVTFNDVPNEACVALVTGQGTVLPLVGAAIGAGNAVAANTLTPTNIVATATSICGSTTVPTGGRSAMSFRFQ